MSNIYSTQKLVHHPKALQMMHERQHQNPIQIHFMPALACNQSCHFCTVAGTLIETSRGRVPVELVRTGDSVTVGNRVFRVLNTGSRWAENVYMLEVDGHGSTYITGEHPIFTESKGFVETDAVRPGDRVGTDVRVWVRRSDKSAQARKAVEVEHTHRKSPVPWPEGVSLREEVDIRKDEGTQSDEAFRGGCSGEGDVCNKGGLPTQPNEGRSKENIGGSTQEDVGTQQPDEGPRDSTPSFSVGLLRVGEDTNGEVVSQNVSRGGVHRPRNVVDCSKEPGLPSGEETLCGSNSIQSVQVGEGGEQLCYTHHSALREEGMEVSGRVSPVTQAGVADSWTAKGGRVFYRGEEVSHLRFGEVLVCAPVSGTFRVYSIEVEEGEAFIANGVMVHNCSYGHRVEGDGPEQQGWKNMAMMSDDHMPLEKMQSCLTCWQAMGVKAVELTGGGEPLIYPYVDVLFEDVATWGVDFALVTNGTALTPNRARNFGKTNWKWARVSIDAGNPLMYTKTRRVPESHWALAWKAVEALAGLKRDKEQRVGVGYVVDTENYDGVYDACRIAWGHGADNIRVALALTPHNLARFPAGAIEEAGRQAAKAKIDFEGKLQVNDLVSERAKNMASPAQDYHYCAVKEILCVVGGDMNVYTCCSLAFSPKGLIGSIQNQSFSDLWWSQETQAFFAEHDAVKVCNVPCLYEVRNKNALVMLKNGVLASEVKDDGIHRNFI